MTLAEANAKTDLLVVTTLDHIQRAATFALNGVFGDEDAERIIGYVERRAREIRNKMITSGFDRTDYDDIDCRLHELEMKLDRALSAILDIEEVA